MLAKFNYLTLKILTSSIREIGVILVKFQKLRANDGLARLVLKFSFVIPAKSRISILVIKCTLKNILVSSCIYTLTAAELVEDTTDCMINCLAIGTLTVTHL
jgi:hypothetical protein